MSINHEQVELENIHASILLVMMGSLLTSAPPMTLKMASHGALHKSTQKRESLSEKSGAFVLTGVYLSLNLLMWFT